MELKDKKVLIVDDEAELRNIFMTEFKFYNSITFEAHNSVSAIEILKKESVDLILSDIRMPGGDGIELLKYVNENIKPFPHFIMLTGYSDLKKEEATKLGVTRLFSKPFDLDEIFQFIQNLD